MELIKSNSLTYSSSILYGIDGPYPTGSFYIIEVVEGGGGRKIGFIQNQTKLHVTIEQEKGFSFVPNPS